MSTNKLATSFSDNRMLVGSKWFVGVADDTYNIAHLPKYSLVTAAYCFITTAYSAGGTITIGYTGNGEGDKPEAFMSEDIAKATVTGMKQGMVDTLLTVPAKYFNSAGGVVTVTTGGSAATKGTFRVFINYTLIY